MTAALGAASLKAAPALYRAGFANVLYRGETKSGIMCSAKHHRGRRGRNGRYLRGMEAGKWRSFWVDFLTAYPVGVVAERRLEA